MYLISKTSDKADMVASHPFGPGFTAVEAARAASMEAWGTSLSDTEEYTEFRLLDAAGKLIGQRRIRGY